MDDRILFDRFHEALETEPRPGAYERLRFAMADHPIALKRRPVYQMRWSRMGLRMAAALTAAAIAIAVFAVFLATHHAPVGAVPAGQDQNVKAYEALNFTDYNRMQASTSNHCNTIEDTGCAAAVVPVNAELQRWADDLVSFKTPARFALIDGLLRHHLSEAIFELNATVAFQRAGNQAGFNMAIGAADFEDGWLSATALEIDRSINVASSYHDVISFARESFAACVSCQSVPNRECTGASAQDCENDVQSAEMEVQTFLLALLRNPAPGALASRNAELEADLARADTALVAITHFLIDGDAGNVSANQASYGSAISSADADASALAGA